MLAHYLFIVRLAAVARPSVCLYAVIIYSWLGQRRSCLFVSLVLLASFSLFSSETLQIKLKRHSEVEIILLLQDFLNGFLLNAIIVGTMIAFYSSDGGLTDTSKANVFQ